MPRSLSQRRTTRACETCGKPFPFIAYPSEIALGRGRFCSKPCQKAWQSTPLIDLFFHHVGRKTATGCILWTGRTDRQGYGTIKSGGRHNIASRVSYELFRGPIPDGLCVLHDCDRYYLPGDIGYRLCINPTHLFLGTQADNMIDMAVKGRGRRRVPGSHRWNKEQH